MAVIMRTRARAMMIDDAPRVSRPVGFIARGPNRQPMMPEGDVTGGTRARDGKQGALRAGPRSGNTPSPRRVVYVAPCKNL